MEISYAQVLFFVFMAVFISTTIVTLLGIVGLLKKIKDTHLNQLFKALILESIAAVVLLFINTDFSERSANDFIQKDLELDKKNVFEAREYIKEQFIQAEKCERCQKELDNCLESLERCEGDISEIERSFYAKIARLRVEMTHYEGAFININYRARDKEKVYDLLRQIFEILGYIEDEDVTNDELKEVYRRFQEERASVSDPYHIWRSDIALMVRYFLDKYPE